MLIVHEFSGTMLPPQWNPLGSGFAAAAADTTLPFLSVMGDQSMRGATLWEALRQQANWREVTTPEWFTLSFANGLLPDQHGRVGRAPKAP